MSWMAVPVITDMMLTIGIADMVAMIMGIFYSGTVGWSMSNGDLTRCHDECKS